MGAYDFRDAFIVSGERADADLAGVMLVDPLYPLSQETTNVVRWPCLLWPFNRITAHVSIGWIDTFAHRGLKYRAQTYLKVSSFDGVYKSWYAPYTRCLDLRA